MTPAPTTAHMSNFDPIPRLQQIVATIEDGGHFDSPATAAHYINCAIKEIGQLRKERDALIQMRERQYAAVVMEDNNACLTAERDEMRRQRDEARREVCKRVESASCLSDGEPTTLASDYARWCGWDCFPQEDGK